MKFKTAITILLAFAAIGLAQDRMADTLRKGILEEESRHDLGKAVQQYYDVLRQYGEVRQTAATALFRMAECFRKQGNRPRAIESYQRILHEFADQTKLAAQSRTILATTYKPAPGQLYVDDSENDKAKFDKLMEQQKQQLAAANGAILRYRAAIQNEMDAVRAQLATAQERYKAGAAGAVEVNEFKAKLAQLDKELAASEAGLTSPK